MAKEIELKIRLADPQRFQEHLAALASPLGPYHKTDTYFKGGAGSFRLREGSGRATVCRKEKVIEAGIEVSRETEFAVDTPQAFREFAQALGYQEWYKKEKRGQAWRWGDILIEEGTVETLGWFAELEVLLDEGADAAAVAGARERLQAALKTLNVSLDCLEPRTYAELLGHRGP
jgi:predicted adenylyl cyclase CyaB